MRYTPPQKEPPDRIEQLRQSWLSIDPLEPSLDRVGRTLAIAARLDPARFRSTCRELVDEQ